MTAGLPPSSLVQLRTLQRGIKLNSLPEHATSPPAASPTTSHPDCHYGHLTDATVLVCFLSPDGDDAIESSQARGKLLKMRLAMYAGVCVPAPAPAPAPAPLLRAHAPLPSVARMPIRPCGPAYTEHVPLLQLC